MDTRASAPCSMKVQKCLPVPSAAAWLSVAAASLRALCPCWPRRARPARRTRRARALSGRDRRLRRLPHAAEDGHEWPRARHLAAVVRPSGGAGHAARSEAAARAVAGRFVGDQHGVGGSLGRELYGQPDPRCGDRPWRMDPALFTRTMRTGRHFGVGRVVLPPMPIPAYRNFTDADLEAIFSYLKSIPPVKNHVPAPVPPDSPQPRQ